MGSWILRFLFFLICGVSGYSLAAGLSSSYAVAVGGLSGGLLLAGLTLLMEGGLKKVPLRNLLGSLVGLILGMIVANLISNVFLSNLLNHQEIALPLFGGLYGVCGYIGLQIGFKKGDEIHFPGWNPFSKGLP